MSDAITINNGEPFIDHCAFKYNNNSHCFNRTVAYVCGHCTNKFCYDHLIEHEHANEQDIARSNMVLSSSSSNVDRLTDAAISSLSTCTSSCSSDTCSSLCSCATRSSLSKATSVSDESAIMFHPMAISTPAHLIDYHISIKQEMSGYVNDLSIDHSINILSSTTNNEQHSPDTIPDESMNVLSAAVASDQLLLLLESTIKEKSITKKRNKTLQGESFLKENDERLNRSNFFLKNITTSMTYMDIFISIATMYPLVQIQTIDNSSKIEYLCVADTSKSSAEKLVSIHLCFAKKVNFKRKFLNHLFQDLKISDYLHMTNGDQFNDEIKLLSNERYIESRIYTAKKDKFASSDDYRKKQDDVARACFEQESFTHAVAIVRNNLKFEYLVRGRQIRENIDYELELAKKQKTMEYKPIYDPSSFKIPEEHRQDIEDWLKNDFRMRIDGIITRSRTLFLTGPTKYGKTSWARSLGAHNSYVINFSLADWRDDVDYIILDDVHWKSIEPIAKGILIAPGEVTLTDKYMSKKKINNNKPCIFCVNDYEASIILASPEANYWRANGVWIHLRQGQKMF